MGNAASGFVIAAPHSGSGKTLISLGLCRAFTQAGIAVAPAKSGPDYIDPHFLARAAQKACVNLDAWAMSGSRLAEVARRHSASAEILLIEGVMGLFDGAQDGTGSTADVAAALGLPVVLVVDASHMAQSVAAVAFGFKNFRPDVEIAGVILNRVASDKHEVMLRNALSEKKIFCFGAIRRDVKLSVPSRHLGLYLPNEVDEIETIIEAAATAVRSQLDLTALTKIAAAVAPQEITHRLPPLGQRIAIAKDAAFSFVYEHWMQDWREQGATLTFFSPLANEAPDAHADAIFLPGGYPELHGGALAAADKFKSALHAAASRDVLIYGECGGYMVLGESLTDKKGHTHKMMGLLSHHSHIDKPRRTLGYRQLENLGPLPFGHNLKAHEFHYSSQVGEVISPLFKVRDAAGNTLDSMGDTKGRTCGSYAHIIEKAAI